MAKGFVSGSKGVMVGYIRIIDVSHKPGGWTVAKAKHFLQRAEQTYGEKYPSRYSVSDDGRIEGLILGVTNDRLCMGLAQQLERGGVHVEVYGSLVGAQNQLPQDEWELQVQSPAQPSADRESERPPMRPPATMPPRATPQPSPPAQDPKPIVISGSEQGVDFFRLNLEEVPVEVTKKAARGIAVMYGRPPEGLVVFVVRFGMRRGDEPGTYWAGFNHAMCGDVFERLLEELSAHYERRKKLPGENPNPVLSAVLEDVHPVRSPKDTSPAIEEVRPPEKEKKKQDRPVTPRRGLGLTTQANAARAQLREEGLGVDVGAWAGRLRQARDQANRLRHRRKGGGNT